VRGYISEIGGTSFEVTGKSGGMEVLLSAKRVGPTGKAYGLDMTDEMLALANENKRKAGVENVEFLKGEIENIPLPDDSVDVIISNCVINLSADKDWVLREARRVLKPGGRFAVSDVVARGEMLPEIRQSVLLWVGCVAGALEENEYRTKLASAGFEKIEIEPTRIYRSGSIWWALLQGPVTALQCTHRRACNVKQSLSSLCGTERYSILACCSLTDSKLARNTVSLTAASPPVRRRS